MKKKVLGTLLAAMMVGAMLTGCVTDGSSSGSDTAEKTADEGSSDGAKKFAAFVPTMTNPYWVSELGQLESDIEADGGTLDILSLIHI